MRENFRLFILVSGVLSASMHASTKSGYQSATVISVESHENPFNYAGGNPSDAPLRSQVYSYYIGIRLGCTIYQTRYDTAFEYLPTVFTPNHLVDIIPQRRVIYVRFPGDREVRMGVDSRSSVKGQPCVVRH